jgi:hypothetical protein
MTLINKEVREDKRLKERFGAKDPYDASRARRYPLVLLKEIAEMTPTLAYRKINFASDGTR